MGRNWEEERKWRGFGVKGKVDGVGGGQEMGTEIVM